MSTDRSTARRPPPASPPAGTAVACALILLTACGGGDDPEAAPGAGTGGTPVPTASAQPTTDFNDADVAFARMMIPHDEQAVQLAGIAAGRAADPELGALAAEIGRERGQEIAAMTGWLAAWGKTTASAGPGGQDIPGRVSEAGMAGLRRAEGAEFDRRFAELMIDHDRGAVEMAVTEQEEGLNPAARRFAETVEASRQAEIVRLEKAIR
ncbi:DUF305 domain-containing protein [Planomonospora algeriensis]